MAPQKKLNKTCMFCHSSEVDDLHYGKFYTTEGIVVHYYCLLLSSGVAQNGEDDEGILGFLPEDIKKELNRGKSLPCSYCHLPQATLGCCVKKCKKIFHLPCGFKRGSLHQFFDEFKTYCCQHRPQQVVEPVGEQEKLCPICIEEVGTSDSVRKLWGTCCKKAFYHHDCMQRLAHSCGKNSFKCPLCNNTDAFQEEMMAFGIYIPEQDAAWELEPNAFQELLQRYDTCDATRCSCPMGRKFNADGTNWQLILCSTCGSSGIHVKCGKLKCWTRDWQCNECRPITSKAKKKKNGSQKRIRRETDVFEDEEPPVLTLPSSCSNTLSDISPPRLQRADIWPSLSSSPSPPPSPIISTMQSMEDCDSDVDVVSVVQPLERIVCTSFGENIPVVAITAAGVVGPSGEEIPVFPIVKGDINIPSSSAVPLQRVPSTTLTLDSVVNGGPSGPATENPEIVKKIVIPIPDDCKPLVRRPAVLQCPEIECIEISDDDSDLQPLTSRAVAIASPPEVQPKRTQPAAYGSLDHIQRYEAMKRTFLEPGYETVVID